MDIHRQSYRVRTTNKRGTTTAADRFQAGQVEGLPGWELGEEHLLHQTFHPVLIL